MDIYAAWLDSRWYYTVHLFAWMLPIVLLQWLVFRKILWANRRAIALPTLLVGSYLSATDIAAVAWGIWHFDAKGTPMTLGITLFGVPLEEYAFFFLTALLVSQSFILFLPEKYRHPAQ